MVRVLVVTGPLLALLLNGCMGVQKRDAKVAELQSELATVRGQSETLAGEIRTVKAENQKLKTNAGTSQGLVTQLRAAAAKGAGELRELKKKYAGVDAVLVEELRGVPGVFADRKGVVEFTGLSFDFAGGKLKPESMKTLKQVADALAKRKGLVYVDGHTDNVRVGNPETKKHFVDNLGLSLARAAAVARGLIEAKVSPKRLVVRGFGSSRPIAKNDTREGRAKNRRVEIRLVPPETKSR